MAVRSSMWLAIIVAMTGSAFAQEPAPAQPAPAAAPTPASAPTPATPAAPAAAQTTDANETKSAPEKSAALEGVLDQDKIMAAQKAGYEIRNENGEVLLCRKDLKTGSRLRHTVSCMTPKQWDQLQTDTQHSLRSIERRRVGPNSN